MSMPVKVDVDNETSNALAGLAIGDLEVLGEALELREEARQSSGLDPRTYALVKIAALNALDAGATPEDILGVLSAIMPQVGGPRAVAAAPEIMVALGLALPDGTDV